MPFVQLSARADELNIFWRSNIPGDDVTQLADCHRPTLLILNCDMLSIEFFDRQFEDHHDFRDFNLLAFDFPGYGLTECPLLSTPKQYPRLDQSALAALIADFCLALELPPVHVWAPMILSSHVACRFALAFPTLCKSLILTSVGQPADDPEFIQNCHDLTNSYAAGSKDRDMLDDCIAMCDYMFFDEVHLPNDDKDRVHEHWITHFSGRKATRLMHVGPSLTHLQPLTPKQAETLEVQITILQGDTSCWVAPQSAHEFASLFPNAVGEVDVHIIHGAPPFFAITEEFAESVDHLVSQHIESATIIAHHMSPHGARKDVMVTALERLAAIEDRPDIATRDWDSIFSFSLRPENVVKEMEETWLVPLLAIEKECA